ncbi:MAG: 50S ribosomal protein L32 [Candidatus Latescibacterota bacterium]|nr:50S ribosomal protein L32 [bacterium]MDA8576305.1 50S ribosomal protein L32 [Candidatus Marinamargulisbacteria bacterium]
MAVPKKRRSKSKKRIKRSAWKAVAPEVTTCSNCGASIRTHTTCSHCGYYKGRQVIRVKSKTQG